MQVETFEELGLDVGPNGEVTNELVSEEALTIISTLGLEGQQSLVEKNTVSSGDTTETRFPYRRMTNEERAVYRAIFPQVTKLERYSLGPVPLKVLQVAAHAKDCFEHLEVWHAQTDREDPLLIGVRNEGQFNTPTNYILARWGEVLKPFEELRAEAKRRLLSKVEKQIKTAQSKLRACSESLDESLDAYLYGERFDDIWVHVTP